MDLRPIAFSKAFDQIAGVPAAAAPPGPGAGGSGGGGGDGAPLSDAIGRIAVKFGVEAEIVERVLDVDEDGVHLSVPRSALNDTKKVAMREVARLIAAARQAAGVDEEYTQFAVIRDTCDDRGVLDSANFAAAMQSLDGDGMRFRGTGRSREVKVNAAGYEKAAGIMRRVAGG